jgi:hypothetical protein
MSNYEGELTRMLRKANTERDEAQYALADYKNAVYRAISGMYEQAIEMFDTADTLPGFITALAEAYNVHTAFTCPVCQVLRPFEMGSGDCQTCEDCCKCPTDGTYCFPYGANKQKEA